MEEPEKPPARLTRKRRRRRFLVALGVIGLLWLAVAAVAVLQAKRAIDDGVERLEEARERLSPGDLVRGEGREALRDAGREFDRARDLVGSPLIAPLGIVPVLGQQVRSVEAQTEAASEVTAIGDEAMAAAEAEFSETPSTGAERVALLRDVETIVTDAERRMRDVDLGADFFLIGPVGDARERFTEKLSEARDALIDARTVTSGFGEFLSGPRRYLLLAANNAEMRAGSGMWLSAGVLTVSDGAFELGEMRATADLVLPAGTVPVDGDLAARWGWIGPTDDYRSLAVTPRFDATAPLAAEMWRALTGEEVDGVLVVDPLTLQALLAAEGPVQAGGRTVDEENVLEYVFLEQYREAQFEDPTQQARRDRLSEIARAGIDALDDRPWEPPDLVDELQPAGQGRHVLAWSRHPVEQRAWDAAGISGTLRDDSLLVSVMNIAGNKLDQFLPVEAEIEVDERAGGSEVSVRLEITDEAPAGEPPYVIGPHPSAGLAAGDYLGILAVDVPGAAGDVRIEGAESLVSAGPDGPAQVVATIVQLAAGDRLALTVRFRMPSGTDSLRVEPSARFPGIQWHYGVEEWVDERVRHVEW